MLEYSHINYTIRPTSIFTMFFIFNEDFAVVKLLISLCLLSMSLTPAIAEILLQDDYSVNQVPPGENARIVEGSLNYSFHRESGGRLLLNNSNTGVSYLLNGEVAGKVKQGRIFLSFTLRSLNASCKDRYAGVFLYYKGEEVMGFGNNYASECFTFWDARENYHDKMSDVSQVIDGQVHKVVVMINNDPAGPEDIKIGLDPFCRRSLDRQPDGIWSEYKAELVFDEIRIRCGEHDSVWEFDELKLATEFNDIAVADKDPGEYICPIAMAAAPAKTTELSASNVVSFWSGDILDKERPFSPALIKQLGTVGLMPGDWQIKPQFSSVNGKRYVYFDIDPEFDLYGSGEVTGSLLRNGYKIVLQNIDIPRYDKPDQLYQSHPWLMGVRPDGSAFGILFDTTYSAVLDLRCGILFSTADNVPDYPVIVVEGSSPQEIMLRLGELTGTMAMPPRWSLGYQQCRWSYYPDARVREIADTFRAKKIPCDVIWFDIHYMEGYRIFTFDKSRFPDPEATNAYLHKLGFRSVWMVDPGIKAEKGYWVCDSGTENDCWVKTASGETFIGAVHPGDCVFPDFTSSRVRNWWGDLYKDFMALGVDGVWNDMNEPFVGGGKDNTMPMDCLHVGGEEFSAGDHAKYHNVYGMLMARASREGILRHYPEKRPFVLTRSNFLGGQRYAATWTGDNSSTWEHLIWSIPMSITLGLSGQPFNGPDLGGFNFTADAELWGHWMAVGAFFPFCRAHACIDTPDKEPWAFGPEIEEVSRIALERRYRLMPYLYTLFVDSVRNGMPVMNPVYFADPSDTDLRMEDEAFLLGNDLLITPKWAKNVRKPKGIWPVVSLVGEDSVADKFQCDLQVRGGAIVPLGPVVQSTAEISTLQDLTLLVVLDDKGVARGRLYEDAGEGYEYLEGQYCLSEFIAEKNKDEIVVKCSLQQGGLSVVSRVVKLQIIDGDKVYTTQGDILAPSFIKVAVK